MHYLRWNIGDYAIESARMTNGQDLAFRRMIELYAKTETPLPTDPSAISIKVGCDEADVIHVLKAAWSVSDSGWVHKGTEEQIEKARRKSVTNRRNIQSRWTSEDTSRIPVVYQSNTTVGTGYLGTGSGTSVPEKQKSSVPYDESAFNRFWDAYGKKKGRKAALAAWKRIGPTESLADEIVQQARSYALTREPKYRKDPERWLRGEHWKDDAGAEMSLQEKLKNPSRHFVYEGDPVQEM